MKSARQIAVEALIAINDGNGYSNLVLDSAIKKNDISKKDIGFVSTLVYGTVERLITLDFVISKYSSVRIKKMSPAVREILRTAVYQIMYMNSVPQSAAVNEAVNLTKIMKVRSASGFVNGVLRSFLRDGGKLPQIKGNRVHKLSIKYSCPEELIKILLEQYGAITTDAVLNHSLGKQPLFCRANNTKITAKQLCLELESEGVNAQEDEESEDCISLSSTGSIQKIKAFGEGKFHIQDKSSQIAVRFLKAKQGNKVLDVCSAPGGKTCTVAELMNNEGSIVACDIFEHKIKLVEDTAKRLGLDIISSQINDGTVYNEKLGKFDRILCDVPCSGIGIMGRKPEIKYKDWKKLEELTEIQYKILETSSKYLLSGGILLYSTCTLNKNENEEIIKKFLENNKDFEPYIQPSHKQGWFSTLLPNEDGCDGFFVASIKKM